MAIKVLEKNRFVAKNYSAVKRVAVTLTQNGMWFYVNKLSEGLTDGSRESTRSGRFFEEADARKEYLATVENERRYVDKICEL
jgi:hypothetical protein